MCSSFSIQFFVLTCLILTSITFERIELQSSDWTQKTRFFKLYLSMLSVYFDIVMICLFSREKYKFVLLIDLSCKSQAATLQLWGIKIDIWRDLAGLEAIYPQWRKIEGLIYKCFRLGKCGRFFITPGF